jgi:hypothetical protein
MYGLSYFTLRTGKEQSVPQLNWDSGRPSKLLRKGRRIVRDGANDVCLETPDGRTLRINRDGSLTLTSGV